MTNECIKSTISSETGNVRHSTIYVKDKGFLVEFYENDVLMGVKEVVGYTLRYAEDMSENYVLGILKLDGSDD
jgi:hypothetical protein